MSTVTTTTDLDSIGPVNNETADTGFKISASNVLIGNTVTSIQFNINASDVNSGIVQFDLNYNGVTEKEQSFNLTASVAETITFTDLSITVSEEDEFSVTSTQSAPPAPSAEVNFSGDDDDSNQQNNFTHIGDTSLLAATITYSEGGGGGTVCLTESCKVLTKSGYKNVGDIKVGDKLLTDKNKESVVKRIYKETKKITEETKPYMVPKNYYGENKPNRDIFISGNHMIKNARKNLWYRTKNVFEQKWDSEEVTYYNFELENYMEDNMIVNGVVMESWDGKRPFEARTYTWKRIKYGYRRE